MNKTSSTEIENPAFTVAENVNFLDTIQDQTAKGELQTLVTDIKNTECKDKVVTDAQDFMKSKIYASDGTTQVSYTEFKNMLNGDDGNPSALKWHKFNIYLGVLLQEKGFLTDAITGELGANTKDENSNSTLRKAVGAFQKKVLGKNAKEYIPDYVPGPITINALLNYTPTSDTGVVSTEVKTLTVAPEVQIATPSLSDILADTNKLKEIKEPKIGNVGIGEFIYESWAHWGDFNKFEYDHFKICIGLNPTTDAFILYKAGRGQNGTNEELMKDLIYNNNGNNLLKIINIYNASGNDMLEEYFSELYSDGGSDKDSYIDLIRHISQFDETKEILKGHIYKKRKGPGGKVQATNYCIADILKKDNKYNRFTTNHLDTPPAQA